MEAKAGPQTAQHHGQNEPSNPVTVATVPTVATVSTVATAPTTPFPRLDCGGRGFYQVAALDHRDHRPTITYTLDLVPRSYRSPDLQFRGVLEVFDDSGPITPQVAESCYSFTFYRSLTYSQAEAFCQVGQVSYVGWQITFFEEWKFSLHRP